VKHFGLIPLALVLAACSKGETTAAVEESSAGSEVSALSPVDPRMTLDRRAANFHSALDARYAISGEWLYSIYLHPLESLSDGELRSAVSQVVMLVKTYGTTYSSAGIVFGGGAEQP